MADAHSDEPDVFHECRRLAGQRDDHVQRLQAFADRYGHDSDEELQQLHSAFFGGTRQGGLAVLLDIDDLYVMACECDITCTVIGRQPMVCGTPSWAAASPAGSPIPSSSSSG